MCVRLAGASQSQPVSLGDVKGRVGRRRHVGGNFVPAVATGSTWRKVST